MQIGIDSFAAAYTDSSSRRPRRIDCASWWSKSSSRIRWASILRHR